MSNAIRNFRTIHNNVFIFAPIFIYFFKAVGPKPKSILLSYLVLPFVLPLSSRKSLINSNVTSTIFSFLSKKDYMRGLSDRLAYYRVLTNHCLQYLIDVEMIKLGADDSVIVLSDDIETRFSPEATPHAAKKFGTLLKPHEIPVVYRLMQIRKL